MKKTIITLSLTFLSIHTEAAIRVVDCNRLQYIGCTMDINPQSCSYSDVQAKGFNHCGALKNLMSALCSELDVDTFEMDEDEAECVSTESNL